MALKTLIFCVVFVLGFSLITCQSEKGKSNNKEEIIFQQNCALCHGLNGEKQLSGAKKLTESVISKDEIKVLVSNGMRQMPAFKERLTEKEIDLVSTYAFQFRDHK